MNNSTEFNDIDNLDHDPEIAVALGNMVVAWAKAETILCWCFAAATGIHFNQATIGFYRIPTFEARVKTTLGLMEDWQPTKYDKTKMLELIEKMSRQSKKRNAWVHGVWCQGKQKGETVTFRFRLPEGDRLCIIKANDIKNHTAALRETTNHLAILVNYSP